MSLMDDIHRLNSKDRMLLVIFIESTLLISSPQCIGIPKIILICQVESIFSICRIYDFESKKVIANNIKIFLNKFFLLILHFGIIDF